MSSLEIVRLQHPVISIFVTIWETGVCHYHRTHQEVWEGFYFLCWDYLNQETERTGVPDAHLRGYLFYPPVPLNSVCMESAPITFKSVKPFRVVHFSVSIKSCCEAFWARKLAVMSSQIKHVTGDRWGWICGFAGCIFSLTYHHYLRDLVTLFCLVQWDSEILVPWSSRNCSGCTIALGS